MELRPDLSCLWKLLGDACTAVSTVWPSRARLAVPAPLAGLVPDSQNQPLDQAQALRVGERYDHKSVGLYFSSVGAGCQVWLLLPRGLRLLLCVQMLHPGLEADA